MSEPRTEAGRALARHDDYGGGYFAERVVAIEAQAVDAWLASPEAAEELARAYRRLLYPGTPDDEALGGWLRDAVTMLTALRKEREVVGS